MVILGPKSGQYGHLRNPNIEIDINKGSHQNLKKDGESWEFVLTGRGGLYLDPNLLTGFSKILTMS